jgi:hypothetical protein
MSWVRSKVRQAALLALFALAVQLMLSFGHVHADAVAHASTVAEQASGGTHQAAAPASGPHHHPDGLAADGCVICATIALSGTLLAAVPPTLPVPAWFAVRSEATASDLTLPEPTRTAFRSRAPPHS